MGLFIQYTEISSKSMLLRIFTGSRSIGKKEPNKKLPHNKRIELTALGRHGLCLCKARAGDAPAPGFPAGHLRPRAQVTPVLYGLIQSQE
jgi:hypothetical protein